MRKLQIGLLFVLCFFCLACQQISSDAIKPVNLQLESLHNPLGIDTPVPRFSWQLSADDNAAYQKAYRILVASSARKLTEGEADIWDSQKVPSETSIHIPYKGTSLKSGKEYYWKVKVWDNHGNESAWSKPAKWSMGLLNPEDWEAQWITYDTTRATSQPLFRKTFNLPAEVRKATAYISGLGYYEMYLNGEKAGDHVLDPGRTNYDDYALYATHDVSGQLDKGENAVGVMLGDGWYNQDRVWGGMSYGIPKLICQIEVELSDGSTITIASDDSWKWANGPVIRSNVYAGEVHDARKEIDGWSTTAAEEADWMPAEPAMDHPPELKAQMFPPIRRMGELKPDNFYKVGDQKYIFDFGQNFAGWTRLKVKAPAGTRITMRSAEEVFSDGTLDSASTGVFATKVVQTEEYISKEEGTEMWEPRFTYHGFRYVEVSGLPYEPDEELLTGIVVYSSVEKTGNFKTSNPQINRLHELSRWTLTSNLHSVPTDCPHREKDGWLGDAHAIAKMSIYNYDMEAFWLKYLNDIRSSAREETKTLFFKSWNEHEQRIKPAGIPFMVSPGKRRIGAASPDWGTTVVQLPWYLYVYYGNKRVLQDFYPDMKQWVSYVEDLSSGYIVKNGLGDWCPPGQGCVSDATPMPLTSTAFHYLDVKIMERVAAELGRGDDRKYYRRLKEKIEDAFLNRFYDSTEKTFGSQTANSMALDLGLVPEGDEQAVSDQIARLSREKYAGFLNTGIFGLARIFGALSDYGNAEAAYNILTKKGFNSFAYMWNHYDATTLWETLPVNDFYAKGKDEGAERSHNHPMQGGYDAWFYQGILGIRPDPGNPGFKNIIFKPEFFEQLDWAKGTFDSPYGPITSDWRWSQEELSWKISIPPSSTGELQLPYDFADTIEIDKDLVQGEKITGRAGISYYYYQLESGKHAIKMKY